MLRPALALLLLAGPACAGDALGGPATVVDRDTIEVRGARVRLYGIDAPEAAQVCESADGRSYRCGREATLALQARIGAAPVACERREAGPNGRVTAVCRANGEDLGAWMVAQGHALASRGETAPYARQEGKAWATRRGLWAGTFERPADWRGDHRRVEAAAD